MVSDVLVSSISDSECRLKVTKSVAYAAFVHAAIKSMLIIVLVFIDTLPGGLAIQTEISRKTCRMRFFFFIFVKATPTQKRCGWSFRQLRHRVSVRKL